MAKDWRDSLDAQRKKFRAKRRHGGHDDDPRDLGTPYERDRDRILYSRELRRLSGITQVTAVHERHLLHNRLTHSMKVAQMGRRIAERLCRESPSLRHDAKLIPEVVEAAGLAHDLGHPPFGHAAERVLNRVLLGPSGGFEGNAQTFRIATKLAEKGANCDAGSPGLDLTRHTLDGILKYPQMSPPDEEFVKSWTDRSLGEKWGAYRSEVDDFNFARKRYPDASDDPIGAMTRSANAVIMDWADDVSFATHDLEDYISADLIRPERLRSEEEAFREYAMKRMECKLGFRKALFEPAFASVMITWSRTDWPYGDSPKRRALVREGILKWIGQLDRACKKKDEPPFVWVAEDAQYQAEILKKITDFYVVDNPGLQSSERGEDRLIEDLFFFLCNWVVDGKRNNWRGVPSRLVENYILCGQEVPSSPDYAVYRAVSDFLCSLTEDQVFDLFERMTGRSRASIFGTWISG